MGASTTTTTVPNPNPNPNLELLRQNVMEDLGKFLQESSRTVNWILSRLNTVETLIPVSGSNHVQNGIVGSPSSQPQHVDHRGDSTAKAMVSGQWSEQQSEEVNHDFPVVDANPKTGSLSLDEDELKNFLEDIQKTYLGWFGKHKNLSQGASPAAVVERSSYGNPQAMEALMANENCNVVAHRSSAGSNTENAKQVSLVERPLAAEAQQPKAVLQNTNSHVRDAALLSDTHETPASGLTTHGIQYETPVSGSTTHEIPLSISAAHSMSAPNSVKDNTELATVHQNPNPESVDVTAEGVSIISEDGVTIVNNFVTPNKSDKDESGMALTMWTPKGGDSYRRTVEVISSPDWLPEGWITELRTRGSGNSAGSKDKYYVEPVSKRRFRSRKEVFGFLETGKNNRQRKSSEASLVRKILEPDTLPRPAKQTPKRAKLRDNVTASSIVPTSNTASSTGPYMPYRSGQPSEWLVYESLASLPFPMFDPFKFGDPNASKSSSSKSPQMPPRPWFFTGPDTSWMPIMGKSGDKGRDYPSPYAKESPYASEASTKKTGRGRKASKKTAASGAT